MTADKRLYGLPDAEVMYDDPASVYESEIDPYYDEPRDEPWIIEEWTVYPSRHHLPAADTLVEWVDEWIAENGEVGESIDPLLTWTKVELLAEQFLQSVADTITWSMAKDRVAEHTVTWNSDDEPLLDGEPMYVKRSGGVTDDARC